MPSERHPSPVVTSLAVVDEADRQKRAPGRPPVRSPDETRQIIIEAAAVEFVMAGFAQASIGRIAQAAGVSTRTLYKLATGKDDLFRLVAEQRIARIVAGFSQIRMKDLSPMQELCELARAYALFVIGPEVSATISILAEQQERFPDLLESFRLNAQRVADAFDLAVDELFSRYFPARHDSALVSQVLRLTFLGQQRQQTLGLASPLNEVEIAAFAEKVIWLLVPAPEP